MVWDRLFTRTGAAGNATATSDSAATDPALTDPAATAGTDATAATDDIDDIDDAGATPEPPALRVALDARSVWQAAWIVVLVVAIAAFTRFVFTDGGSIFFSVTLAFFFALAIEPIVGRLARHMPRGAATALTFVGITVGMVGFFGVFGAMLTDQLTALVRSLPDVTTTVLDAVNTRFGLHITTDTILSDLGITNQELTTWATSLAGGVVGLVSNTLGFALASFSFAFLAYFLSAGLPALRLWIAGLLDPRRQVVFHTAWRLMVIKVGGYVASRMTLALISGTASGLFMALIGMNYWLPLGIWTGIVAQFVPTVGTYISIALPVIVGLSSSEPMDGVWVLVFAIAYQQVENVTIEPRISARAVDLHPAVSFVAALLGASLFGVAGALLGVPVAATIVALFDIYSRRYEVSAAADSEAAALVEGNRPPDDSHRGAGRRPETHRPETHRPETDRHRARAAGSAAASGLLSSDGDRAADGPQSRA